MYAIIEASPQTLAKISSYEDKFETAEKPTATKYPWLALKIGQCFVVPFSDGNEPSLRNGASTHSKTTGKRFIVKKHAEQGCFECARLA